jgi:hypothetical protein
MEEGIRKIGEIEGVNLYYDKYVEENNFLMGKKGKNQNVGLIYMPYLTQEDIEKQARETFEERQQVETQNTDVDFIIGSTEDIEQYKKALELYRKR